MMFLLLTPVSGSAEFLGCLNCSEYDPDSIWNPYGRYGSPYSPYSPDSLHNPYGQYGNPYSPKSPKNPYSTDGPKIYNSEGEYRGNLNSNPYDSDSISNPYSPYGNPYSLDSPFNLLNQDEELLIFGDD
jgi:hypothetical protein